MKGDVIHLIVTSLLILSPIPTMILSGSCPAPPTRSFSGGNGTAGNPYQISDIHQLQNISEDLTAHYILISDMDCSESEDWNGGKGFDPLGGQGNPFEGSLDGNHHVPRDLFINRSQESFIGIFGSVGPGGSIDNIDLRDLEIRGNFSVGSLAGDNRGTISNCSVSGNITGFGYVGGVVGMNSGGSLRDCSSEVSVAGNRFVGGITGISSGYAAKCHSDGRIMGNTRAGGLFGSNKGFVSDSSSGAGVYGIESLGGVTGVNTGMIQTCLATGRIRGANRIGGIAGNSHGAVIDSVYRGNVSGYRDVIGGLVGENGNDITSCSMTGSVFGSGNSVGGLVGWNRGNSTHSFSTCDVYGSGYGTGGVAGSSCGVVDSCEWTGSIYGNRSVGGLIGEKEGPVENCSASGYVSGSGIVGGLIGSNAGPLSNCSSTCNVNGERERIGGLVGLNSGEVDGIRGRIIDCGSEGEVSGKESTGGLIGWSRGIVLNCVSDCDVFGTQDVGGLVGTNYGAEGDDGWISESFSSGSIIGRDNVGGSLGTNTGKVSSTVSSGKVSGSRSIGGFAGKNSGNMTGCYSSGEVSGNRTVGGLIGDNSGNVETSHSEGDVRSETGHTGGLVGYTRDNTIRNSFYDIDSVLINGESRITPYGIFGKQYAKWIEDGKRLEIRQYLDDIPGTGQFAVSSQEDLLDMLPFAIEESHSFLQTSDLHLTRRDLNIPVMGSSVYDGGGHVISGVDINQSFGRTALFGYIGPDTTVMDLILEDVKIKGSRIVGGLSGTNRGRISDCEVTGTISGKDIVGALTGENDGDIHASFCSGTTSGRDSVGGITGSNIGGIFSCRSDGNVSGEENVGGQTGVNKGRMENCSSRSVPHGSYSVGGLVGNNLGYEDSFGAIYSCRARADFEGNSFVGGLSGNNSGTVSGSIWSGNISGIRSVGGLTGSNHAHEKILGVINECVSSGRVEGEEMIGGLAGENKGRIRHSSSEGDVHGNFVVGGLIGTNFPGGRMTGSRRIGDVSGDMEVGGLAGNNSDLIENCYLSGDVIGEIRVGGLAGYNENMISSCYQGGDTAYDEIGGAICGINSGVLSGCVFKKRQGITIPPVGSGHAKGTFGFNSTEMKSEDNFTNVGWNFDSIWSIMDGHTHPFLKWERNMEPVITGENVETALEDLRYEVNYTAIDHDPSDVGLRWILETDSSWLSIGERSGVLSGVPGNGDVGSYFVNVSVIDSRGGKDFTNFTLEVVNTNDDPVLTMDPENITSEDEHYSMNLSAFDPDSTKDTITWSMNTDARWLIMDRSDGWVFGIPENGDVGSYFVNISASDGKGGMASMNFTLVVENVNDPPVWVDFPGDIEITEGEVCTINAEARDEDSGDTVYYSLKEGAPHWISIDEVNGTISLTAPSPGNYRIEIFASDGNMTIGHILNLTVTAYQVEGGDRDAVNTSPVVIVIILVFITLLIMVSVLFIYLSRRNSETRENVSDGVHSKKSEEE